MLKTKFMNSIIYKRQISILIAMFVLTFCRTLIGQYSAEQNWIHYARITGNILGLTNIEKTMQAAVDHGTLGIELDNDITGRYDSFLDPTLKLRQIKKAADAAHKIGNYAFIYIAGLECIAENADKTEHTMFKDHPDWVQRDINGKPAIFKLRVWNVLQKMQIKPNIRCLKIILIGFKGILMVNRQYSKVMHLFG